MSNDLRNRLEERAKSLGIFAKRSLGQNFLVSESVVEKIIQSANDLSNSSSKWIEIGPGLGSLTDRLLETRGERPLTLIELDHQLVKFWSEKLQSTPGCSVLEADALKLNWESVNGDILVSNLPYQISSSLVIELSTNRNSVNGMVLMFQKEVAQRIRAKPKTEDYGLLSVIAQVFWKIEVVCEAGPRDFDPAPRVASRVLQFSRLTSPVPGEESRFLGFCKAAWAQRRKKLIKNLAAVRKSESLAAAWSKLGLSETARAEELDPQQFVQLYVSLK